MNYQRSNGKKYDCLRIGALWAGGLGVVQSAIWISLTTSGIFAYNCIIDLPAVVNFGTIVRYVFFYLYFKGDCKPEVYQPFDHTILDTVDRILDPTQILIWMSVYLAASIAWLLASVLLLAYITKYDVITIGILYSWAILTFLISALDLAQGIIFGIDWATFHKKALLYNIEPGPTNPNAVLLLAGEISAFALLIISLKGFVLWIINVGLIMYLTLQANSIVCDKDENDILFMSGSESTDILTNRPPINAFDNCKSTGSYINDGFMQDNNSSMGTVKLNQEAIVRAARMSIDARLQEYRFRNLDSFQQHPPPHNNNSRRESIKGQETVTATVNTISFPVPDYSD